MGFLERNRDDAMLFVFVTAVQDVFPNVSDERAIERYLKKFGHICQDCTTEDLRHRLKRMRVEYLDTLKTKDDA